MKDVYKSVVIPKVADRGWLYQDGLQAIFDSKSLEELKRVKDSMMWLEKLGKVVNIKKYRPMFLTMASYIVHKKFELQHDGKSVADVYEEQGTWDCVIESYREFITEGK